MPAVNRRSATEFHCTECPAVYKTQNGLNSHSKVHPFARPEKQPQNISVMGATSEAVESVVVLAFGLRYYRNLLISVLLCIKRRPIISLGFSLLVYTLSYLIGATIMSYMPFLTVNGSVLGLSANRNAAAQTLIHDADLTTAEFNVLFGALPIKETGDNRQSWYSCEHAIKGNDLNACQKAQKYSIQKIRNVINAKKELLFSSWSIYGFDEQQISSFVWALGKSKGVVAETKGTVNFMMQNNQYFAPTDQQKAAGRLLYDASWGFQDWAIIHGFQSYKRILRGWISKNNLYGEGEVNIPKTHTMLSYISDVHIPFVEWIGVHKKEEIAKVRIQHLNEKHRKKYEKLLSTWFQNYIENGKSTSNLPKEMYKEFAAAFTTNYTEKNNPTELEKAAELDLLK